MELTINELKIQNVELKSKVDLYSSDVRLKQS